jgi:hypothetical protein
MGEGVAGRGRVSEGPSARQECVPKNPGATQPFSPDAASFKDVTAALLFAFTIMPVHVGGHFV